MKNYSKPICKVNELHTESLMQALSFDDNTHPNKDTEVLTGRRRGSWGNLWYEDEE